MRHADAGTLIVTCGLWILTDKNPFGTILHISSPMFKLGVYAFIAVGAVTMFMGFLGCVGAYYGIRCLLGLYIASLLFILVAQIATGVFLFFQQDTVKARTTETIRDLLMTYNATDQANQTLETAWDNIQSQFSCCGWTGPDNWKINAAYQKGNYTFFPCSCSNTSLVLLGFCPLQAPSDKVTIADWPVPKQGCHEALQKWVAGNFDIILGVCAAVGLTELLGMVLSLCLYKSKRHTR
uniref:Tetraspanin n=1 Tax=Pogona vitticeps TaxID=103695 RepID=A0ABM5FGI8_9SAUR